MSEKPWLEMSVPFTVPSDIMASSAVCTLRDQQPFLRGAVNADRAYPVSEVQ